MLNLTSKIMAASVSAMLIAGCGGSGGGGDLSGGGVVPPPANQTITNVFAYIDQLIASNDANSDPLDINVLTLATDDTSEPTPVN